MREFALHADMEYSQLSKIERGVANPTISTVLALAEALGLSHSELFNFKFTLKQNSLVLQVIKNTYLSFPSLKIINFNYLRLLNLDGNDIFRMFALC